MGTNGRIARHMDRRDTAIRRCWKEWVDSGRFQRYDGSDKPRATEDWKDILICQISCHKALFIVITHQTCEPLTVSTMTIHGRLIEQYLRSYRPLRNLPFTPAQRYVDDILRTVFLSFLLQSTLTLFSAR
ncbi:HTH_Tnp_Tc3_2 domain-containing protein [Trichonephila clavipes]|nr:HTH_Tnp_Tc3_2 domain-containing protein [Trichonephila clavipes]